MTDMTKKHTKNLLKLQTIKKCLYGDPHKKFRPHQLQKIADDIQTLINDVKEEEIKIAFPLLRKRGYVEMQGEFHHKGKYYIFHDGCIQQWDAWWWGPTKGGEVWIAKDRDTLMRLLMEEMGQTQKTIDMREPSREYKKHLNGIFKKRGKKWDDMGNHGNFYYDEKGAPCLIMDVMDRDDDTFYG